MQRAYHMLVHSLKKLNQREAFYLFEFQGIREMEMQVAQKLSTGFDVTCDSFGDPCPPERKGTSHRIDRVKINVDISIFTRTNSDGLGILTRNSGELVLPWQRRRMPSIQDAEIAGAREAMVWDRFSH